jgi:hypothetical protein
MAQYFTAFNESPTGAFPSDWTQEYASVSTKSVIVDPSNAANKVLKIASDSGSFDRDVITWDKIVAGTETEDYELLARYYIDQLFGSRLWLAGAVSGSDGSETVYVGVDRPNDYRVEVVKYVAGAFTSVAENTASYVDYTGQYAWLRVRKSGTSLKLRRWPDTDSEPSSWDIETTDSSITAGGKVGIGFISQESAGDFAYFDKFGVGTNGDSAPNSPTTGPNTPINPSITNLQTTSARLNWEQG